MKWEKCRVLALNSNVSKQRHVLVYRKQKTSKIENERSFLSIPCIFILKTPPLLSLMLKPLVCRRRPYNYFFPAVLYYLRLFSFKSSLSSQQAGHSFLVVVLFEKGRFPSFRSELVIVSFCCCCCFAKHYICVPAAAAASFKLDMDMILGGCACHSCCCCCSSTMLSCCSLAHCDLS